jgi:hypothetical protein
MIETNGASGPSRSASRCIYESRTRDDSRFSRRAGRLALRQSNRETRSAGSRTAGCFATTRCVATVRTRGSDFSVRTNGASACPEREKASQGAAGSRGQYHSLDCARAHSGSGRDGVGSHSGACACRSAASSRGDTCPPSTATAASTATGYPRGWDAASRAPAGQHLE